MKNKGTGRKEEGSSSSDMMKGVAEVTLGGGLLNAMIAKARCEEQGMTMEAGIFEETVQRFRADLTEAGLDPDAVVKERIRLLKKSLQ